jgi:hypothetical protein
MEMSIGDGGGRRRQSSRQDSVRPASALILTSLCPASTALGVTIMGGITRARGFHTMLQRLAVQVPQQRFCYREGY